MASVARHYPQTGIWRFTQQDSIFVAFAALHAAVLVAQPMAPFIALGLWWNANTIAHNFIHKPFFVDRWMNRLFSAALSVLLGFPQTLWRDRHVAHHAAVQWRLRVSWQLAWETILVLCLWVAMIYLQPHFFLVGYVPGYFAGLGLCAAQGYWEHAAGAPTSHYGRLYNLLCFNDGYHAEHHSDPGTHWTGLPFRVRSGSSTSGWPAPLRGLEVSPLEALERFVLRSPLLQRFVLNCHRRALQQLVTPLPPIRSIMVVGGGLFPRTALILLELLPEAHLTIVDLSQRNLDISRTFLGDSVGYRQEHFLPNEPTRCDLTVIPLCLEGDRAAIYDHPPSSFVLVHDWIWRRRGASAVVSVALLKRINLVRQ
ncbi:MAG: fatty acid desaturase [Acidobacteriota bacterium]